jgi:hypothetical protein
MAARTRVARLSRPGLPNLFWTGPHRVCVRPWQNREKRRRSLTDLELGCTFQPAVNQAWIATLPARVLLVVAVCGSLHPLGLTQLAACLFLTV